MESEKIRSLTEIGEIVKRSSLNTQEVYQYFKTLENKYL